MNDKFNELEALVADSDLERLPDNSPLVYSRWAFMLGIFGIDAVTSWTVWKITGYLMYGVIWFAIGAVSFTLHQRNWERAGNNEKQERGAKLGMGVSVGAMLVIGVAAAILFVTGVVTPFAESVLLVFIFCLVFFHIGKFAEYYFSDDDWVIRREVTRARAKASKRVEIIEAGDRVMDAVEAARNKRQSVYTKHGDVDAVDEVIDLIARRIRGQQSLSRPREAKANLRTAMAKDVNMVELDKNSPTVAGRN